MKAVMLAAGIGARLGSNIAEPPPKVLLRFGEKSLLEFHINILEKHGIDELVLGVGYKHQDIADEIATLGAQYFVRTLLNKDFHAGNIVTLWALRHELSCGEPVLLMDGDVKRAEFEIPPRIVSAAGKRRAAAMNIGSLENGAVIDL